jgi:heme A synthase
MVSHVGLLVLFALLVSVVFAVLQRDEPAQQLRLALTLFAGFVAAGLALGWLMLLFPIGS